MQQLAIPHLLKGKSALFAAQTGTGKTFSYSLPIIHQLKQSEMETGSVLTMENRPRAVVMVPNRELAMQVLDDGFKPF